MTLWELWYNKVKKRFNYLPRNKDNIEYAKKMRKEMTKQEKHLWFDFLKDYPIRFKRQEITGNYITSHGGFNALLTMIFDKNVDGVCIALFSGTLLMNLILKYKLIKDQKSVEETIKEETFNFERGYLLMQILPIFFYIFGTLFLYFTYYK